MSTQQAEDGPHVGAKRPSLPEVTGLARSQQQVGDSQFPQRAHLAPKPQLLRGSRQPDETHIKRRRQPKVNSTPTGISDVGCGEEGSFSQRKQCKSLTPLRQDSSALRQSAPVRASPRQSAPVHASLRQSAPVSSALVPGVILSKPSSVFQLQCFRPSREIQTPASHGRGKWTSRPWLS